MNITRRQVQLNRHLQRLASLLCIFHLPKCYKTLPSDLSPNLQKEKGRKIEGEK